MGLMGESIQHKLDRVRPPRVQITYDVEIGDAIQMKELPFVVGIMADLSGNPEKALPKMKDRKFVEIDRDNLEDVLESINPRLVLRVPNKLGGEDENISVELKFKSMDDFSPVPVVNQIPALKSLYDSRSQLKDLVTKMDGNDDLEHMLMDIISDSSKRDALKAELNADDASDSDE
jgi:type VI secretion system protein ImpB